MKTVMIFGTFDILHAGHIDLMKQARTHGDRLIAVVARDERVIDLKGTKSVHDEDERMTILGHIDLVDEVVLGDRDDVYKVIETIRPDVIGLGYDQVAYTDQLEEKLSSFGLDTDIVRLAPYHEGRYKSGIIKKKILKHV